jgi:glycosyltransferase involved in cell wall biosynthesis
VEPAATPDVAIVIPTRNRLELLKETLASVDAQTFNGIETILIDDASDDDTPGWLATRADERTKVVRLDARSERSAARNRGLREARGRFVMFLDDDDLLVPSAIERLIRGLEAHERSVAAIGAYVVFDERGNRVRRPHPRRVVERDAWRDVLFHLDAFGSRILFRTEVVRAVGGYREGLAVAEDWDLLLRVSRRGRLLLIPQLVTEYRRHAGQTPLTGLEDIFEELAAEHISTLPQPDRDVAVRVRRARAIYREGDRALADLRPGAAVRDLVSAVRTYPPLLSFPVARPELGRRLAKSVVATVLGSRTTRVLRRVKALGRRIARRDVTAPDDAGTDGP